MDANTRQLKAIFDPSVNFQVPLFQRPYVWAEDENWKPLWEDILALLDRHLRTGAARAHFLGAIVLEQLPNPAGSVEARQVIDGQQRFTTLQLFLMAGRNLAAEYGAERYVGRFRGLVENDDDLVEDPSEKFKLWPTNSDRAAFKAKRPELLKYSKINLTQYFHGPEADDWHEDAIGKRTEHLFGLLLKVWPDASKVAA